MARGPRYHVAFRRRRRNITDYRMRKSMISSGTPRLIVRFSTRYINAQLAEALVEGDRILASVYSKELEQFGWKASFKNIPSAYLTGLLLGKKSLANGIENAILDIGLRRPTTGARIFAVLKGAIDAGVKIPYDEQVLPNASRIKGEHIASFAKSLIEEDQQQYEKSFSKYISKSLKPEQLTSHFIEIKNSILKKSKE